MINPAGCRASSGRETGARRYIRILPRRRSPFPQTECRFLATMLPMNNMCESRSPCRRNTWMTVLSSPSTRLRPRRIHVPAPISDLDRRVQLLKRYGSFTMSYHTLQSNLQYFQTDDGYIAFREKWGITFALCDPVCAPQNVHDIIAAFLAAHPKAVFSHISRRTAVVLARQGFLVNEFGSEFAIDLPGYEFGGKSKRHIKEAANRIRNQGLKVVEMAADDVDRSEVERISEIWRRGKAVNSRETEFLSRPICFEEEMDVRRFFLIGDEGIIAYIHFDPIYREGEVIGYMSGSKRHLPTAPRDHEFGMTKYIIERFQQEGRELLAFGLAPLHDCQDRMFRSNRLTGASFRWLYRQQNQSLFNFRGIAAHKNRYRGRSWKVYFASQARSNVVRLIALMKLCGLCR